MEATILIVLLSLAAVYIGFRAICGFRLYQEVRGPLLVICPETKQSAVVEVAAGTMAVESIVRGVCFRVGQCSRWPMCEDCAQDCLRQIEGRFPELRTSGGSEGS
jgi:hypothetical protein